MHREVLVPRSTGTCESGLTRERGGHRTIPLPAVGARLRANAEGTERFQQVRPQADSYSATPTCTGHHAMPKPAVGARLRANAEGKSLCGVRPQADSYRRKRCARHVPRFGRRDVSGVNALEGSSASDGMVRPASPIRFGLKMGQNG